MSFTVLKTQICVTRPQCVNSDNKRKWWTCVAWIYLAQEMVQLRALVSIVMNISVSYKVGNSLEIWAPISFSMPYVSWGLLYGQHEQPAYSNALLMTLWKFPHHIWINNCFFPSSQPTTVFTKRTPQNGLAASCVRLTWLVISKSRSVARSRLHSRALFRR